jgi:hypothetical protein
MLVVPASGMTETFLEKLKWTGCRMNSYKGMRLCRVINGTWRTSMNVFSVCICMMFPPEKDLTAGG